MFAVGYRMEPAASAPPGRPLKTERPQTPLTGATPDQSSCRRTRCPRTEVRLGARAQSLPPLDHQHKELVPRNLRTHRTLTTRPNTGKAPSSVAWTGYACVR